MCCSYFRCLRNALFIILGGVAVLSNANISHFTLNPLRAPNIWYFTYFRTLKPHKFRDNARGIRNIKRQGMIHKGMFKLINLIHSLLNHISNVSFEKQEWLPSIVASCLILWKKYEQKTFKKERNKGNKLKYIYFLAWLTDRCNGQ